MSKASKKAGNVALAGVALGCRSVRNIEVSGRSRYLPARCIKHLTLPQNHVAQEGRASETPPYLPRSACLTSFAPEPHSTACIIPRAPRAPQYHTRIKHRRQNQSPPRTGYTSSRSATPTSHPLPPRLWVSQQPTLHWGPSRLSCNSDLSSDTKDRATRCRSHVA